MSIQLDHHRRAALDAVLPAIAEFKRAFGRDIFCGFHRNFMPHVN